MTPIIAKCVERHTKDSVNGPLTTVTLVPDGPLNTSTGAITLFLSDIEDLEAYQVGKQFRLVPQPIR